MILQAEASRRSLIRRVLGPTLIRAGTTIRRIGSKIERLGILTTEREIAGVWVDVGAHMGQKTFERARLNSNLTVFAFEPNLEVAAKRFGLLPNFILLPLAVDEIDGCASFFLNAYSAASSLKRLNPEGLSQWVGAEGLKEIAEIKVQTIRLDTFMKAANIQKIDYLKIDAQGNDLSVVKSAGDRIRDVRMIQLEVQLGEIPLYEHGSDETKVLTYMRQAGFTLVSQTHQSNGQEANLTFVNRGWN